MRTTSAGPIAFLVDCVKITLRSWALAAPNAALTAFFGIAASVTIGFDFRGVFATRSDPFESFRSPPDLATIGAFFVILVLGLFVLMIVNAGIYLGAEDALRGRPVRISKVAFGGVAFTGRLLLFGLLMCGIGLACMVVVGLLAMLTGGFFVAMTVPLWWCVGLLASFGFWFVMPFIVLGGESASSALVSSWELAFSNASRVLPVEIGVAIIWLVVFASNYAFAMIPIVSFVAPIVTGALFLAFQAVTAAKLFFELTGKGADPEVA